MCFVSSQIESSTTAMFPDRHGAVSLDRDRAYVFLVSDNRVKVGNATVEIVLISVENCL